MSTITWQIEQMSCYPQELGETDVVFSAAWRVNGTDGTYNATVYGSQSLSPYDGKTPFTPYADLTQAQVIGWVQDIMGEEQVAAINANIEQQIESQVNPTVVTPQLPWLA
jgi:hypothetical protein